MVNLCYAMIEFSLVIISGMLVLSFLPDNGIDWFARGRDSEFKNDILRWISVYGALYSILFIRRIVNTF